MVEEACKFCVLLKENKLEIHPISVNFTAEDFFQHNVFETIEMFCHKLNIDTKYIEVELTESTLIDNYELINSSIRELKKRNISFTIDDFGKVFLYIKTEKYFLKRY